MVGIWELYQPNRKKSIRYTYLHHLKNSINSFYPSILWQEKKEEEERTRPEEIRARCALCKPRSEIIPREGNFIASYGLQQGKTRTNNQIADSEQEFEMYEPRSRRERTPSKKKRWTKKNMDDATYIERYLTSWIPHTLTFLSRCVCFIRSSVLPQNPFSRKTASSSHRPRTSYARDMPPKRTPAAKAPEKPERASRRGRGTAPECSICLRCQSGAS